MWLTFCLTTWVASLPREGRNVKVLGSISLTKVHFLGTGFMECTNDGSLMTSPGGTSLIIHLIGADHWVKLRVEMD
ncbi:hypothetical protein ILYODFUR_015283 [Ilyodon furcidens]|uniref:Secreted protein n=1 Tax=Ilyodon furcidens TaxID=33524 RepID=A0ABV0U5K4_9TELE